MAAKYFAVPWATAGDKAAVPDAAAGDGSVSYSQGYGPYYNVGPPFNATSLPMERTKFNQWLNDITTALQQYQQHSVPDFITTAANDGNVYSYSKYDRVRYDTSGTGAGPFNIYESLINSNTALPTVAGSWVQVVATNVGAIAQISGFKSDWASNTTLTMSGKEAIVEDSSGNTYKINAPSYTIDITTIGAGGCDVALSGFSASSWAYTFMIYNPSAGTGAALLSASATSPTLPSGYTAFVFAGWARLDISKNIVGFKIRNKKFQYTIGSNLASVPQMASGTAGSATTPTWVAVGVANFVPPNAVSIFGNTLTANSSTAQTIVAPSNNYAGYSSSTNPPPCSSSGNATTTPDIGLFNFILESTNIYWASNDGSGFLGCLGFEG